MNATLPGSSLKDFSRILSCFAKIGDDVALEVRPGKLLLSTLNASRSAFVLVTMLATRFERFEYVPHLSTTTARRKRSGGGAAAEGRTEPEGGEGLRCRIQLRALLSIFRPRNIESKDSKDASVEKCELKLLHPSEDATECQLLIRLVCKHGVRKTYKLQYEQTTTMHAVADRTTSHNRFTIAARAMKDVIDHFAPRAEELTLAVSDGNLLLTSFTEGVVSDKEVLKQPIHTSITIDHREFGVMEVDEEVQITFGLREFKALGNLCDLLGTEISVCYGDAGKPLLLDFERDGLVGEFVVATTDDGERDNRATSGPGRTSAASGQYRARTIEAPSQSQRQRQNVGSAAANQPMPHVDSYAGPDPAAAAAAAAAMAATTDLDQGPPRSPSPLFGRDRSALFAPDPDLEDETLQQAQRSRPATARSHTSSSYNQQRRHEQGPPDADAHAREDPCADDEMELYADETRLGHEEEEELGPTQTQRTDRPRGLFD